MSTTVPNLALDPATARALDDWIKSGGRVQEKMWQKKLTNAMQAVFTGTTTRLSWVDKRRSRILLDLRTKVSPILFLACCCTFAQDFIVKSRQHNVLASTEIDDILNRSPERYFPVPEEIQKHLVCITIIQDVTEYKEFLDALNVPHRQVSQNQPLQASIERPSLTPARSISTVITDYRVTPDYGLTSDSPKHEIDAILEAIGGICGVPLLKDIDREQWQPYCACPEIFPAAECWQGGSPPATEPIFDTMIQSIYKSEIEAKYWLNNHTTTAPEALRRMVEPTSEHLCIMDIPTSNQPKLLFPQRIGDRRIIVDDLTDRPSNWSNHGTVVTFHVDGGMEGLTANLGETVKVFFLAPPTLYNLQVMLDARNRLEPERYEHCVMTVTTSRDVIYLPAGCLHATVALKRGYLTGINFVDHYSIHGAVPSLLFSLKKDSHVNLAQDFANFYDALDTALSYDNNSKDMATKIWKSRWRDIKDALDSQSPNSRALLKINRKEAWDRLEELMEGHGIRDHQADRKRSLEEAARQNRDRSKSKRIKRSQD